MTAGLDTKMTPLQGSLWKILRRRFYGIENAAPRAAVLAWYNVSSDERTDLNDREFRDVISVLVSVFEKPICTTPGKGYYVARNPAEKQEAVNYLDSVLREVGQRRAGLVASKTEEEQSQEALL